MKLNVVLQLEMSDEQAKRWMEANGVSRPEVRHDARLAVTDLVTEKLEGQVTSVTLLNGKKDEDAPAPAPVG